MIGGSGTKPRVPASDESVSQAPTVTMSSDEAINGKLARLWMKGMLVIEPLLC